MENNYFNVLIILLTYSSIMITQIIHKLCSKIQIWRQYYNFKLSPITSLQFKILIFPVRYKGYY